ncbi:MAG TPA: class E sortase [Acidimicrobiales bacterium]|nr:class E sortase [Acidimicrobiales bacterium]
MDRRTFLVAGAGALVLAACGTKRAAEDDPALAASTSEGSPTTAASAASAPVTSATPATTVPLALSTLPPSTALPTPRPSPSNALAPEPEIHLGTIAVPRLGLNTTLFEGVTLTTLNKVGVGHWPGTALPSQVGNVVVAGHRVTHSRPFRNIDTLGPGDEVTFTIGNGQHTYTFASNEIVKPNALYIVTQSADRTATLFACHPPGSARFRFVVHLSYVSSTTV